MPNPRRIGLCPCHPSPNKSPGLRIGRPRKNTRRSVPSAGCDRVRHPKRWWRGVPGPCRKARSARPRRDGKGGNPYSIVPRPMPPSPSDRARTKPLEACSHHIPASARSRGHPSSAFTVSMLSAVSCHRPWAAHHDRHIHRDPSRLITVISRTTVKRPRSALRMRDNRIRSLYNLSHPRQAPIAPGTRRGAVFTAAARRLHVRRRPVA